MKKSNYYLLTTTYFNSSTFHYMGDFHFLVSGTTIQQLLLKLNTVTFNSNVWLYNLLKEGCCWLCRSRSAIFTSLRCFCFSFYLVSQQKLSPDKVFHVLVAPCFDKKLEAIREEFYNSVLETRDVDCVLTSGSVLCI